MKKPDAKPDCNICRSFMRFKVLGNTGLNVSALGLGGHEYRWGHNGNLKNSRFTEMNPERRDVISRALDCGVNYFDTTYIEEVQSLGHWMSQLKTRNVMVINGMIIDVVRRYAEQPLSKRSFVREELNARLKLLGSDHFDIFMLCSIEHGYNHQALDDVVDQYVRLKEEGKFRFLGVSCHDHAILLDCMKRDLPIDVAMFPYNFAVANNWGGQFGVLKELLEILSKRKTGCVAMKALNWFQYGIPFMAFGEPDADWQTAVVNNFGWLAGQSSIDTSVVGVETVAELQAALDGTRQKPDMGLLDKYLECGRQFDLLLKNYGKCPAEIQGRALGLIRHFTGQEFGDDIAQYERHWRKEMGRGVMPFSKIG